MVAIDRIGALAAETGCPVHIVHLSSRDGLEAIERWRSRGADISCEVSPNHLFLGAEDMASIGSRMKMNPPVRSRSAGHAAALLEGWSTDGWTWSRRITHRTRAAEKQAADIWSAHSGAAGVETSVAVLLSRAVATGRLTLERFTEVTSAAPARVWGLRGKGRIEVGADADITCLDLEREAIVDEARLHGRSSLSPFRGERLVGQPVATIVGGTIVMREGTLVGGA